MRARKAGDSLTGIDFLWPVHPSAPTAAAVRLIAFERAARNLGIPSTVIVPIHSGEPTEYDNLRLVRVRLYDSLAGEHGFLGAVALLPISILDLVRSIQASEGVVVVSSTPGVFVALQGLAAAKLLGLPFVLDIRDSWEMEKFTHAGRIRNWIKERIERLCARSADRVLCVTTMLAEQLRETYGLRREAVDVVPNGADLALFHPGPGPRNLDLVFSGSPATYRNVRGVLESIARLRLVQPQARAVFLGWDGTPQTPEIRRLVEQLGLSSAVELAPAIAHERVHEVLLTARLGIVSLSGDESFRSAVGAKTYEYIACGVPVACLGEPGDSELRRLVEGHELGFYATTPDEFADRAAEILRDDGIWSRLSANCISASSGYDRRAISERAVRDSIMPFLKDPRHPSNPMGT